MNGKFRRSLIVGISIIAGSFLVFGIVAYFFSDTITSASQKISRDKTVIKNNTDLIEGLAKQKATSLEVKKFADAINLILPQKDDLVNFPTWLDGLSRADQVNVNFSFTGDAVSPTDTDAGFIRFVLNIGGSYSGLTNFLRDVEVKDPKYTVVFDNFDIRRTADNYNANINGRVFFR